MICLDDCLDDFVAKLPDAGDAPSEEFLTDWFTELRALWDTPSSDGCISLPLDVVASGEAWRFWKEGQAIYLLLVRHARDAVVFLLTIEPFKRQLWEAISPSPPWDLRYVANVGVATAVLQSAQDLCSKTQVRQTASVEKYEWKEAAVWGRVELAWVIKDEASRERITGILGSDSLLP